MHLTRHLLSRPRVSGMQHTATPSFVNWAVHIASMLHGCYNKYKVEQLFVVSRKYIVYRSLYYLQCMVEPHSEHVNTCSTYGPYILHC